MKKRTFSLSDRGIRVVKEKKYTEMTRIHRADGTVEMAIPEKDFLLLENVDSNRDIIPSHVVTIQRSVDKFKKLSRPLVAWNSNTGKFVIIDGQHRTIVYMKDGSGCIICMFYEGDISQVMIALNTTAKNWNDEMFANHYINYVNMVFTEENAARSKEYSKLLALMQYFKLEQAKFQLEFGENNIKFPPILQKAIIAGKNRSLAQDDYLEGNFKVSDEVTIKRLHRQILELQSAGIPAENRPINEAVLNFLRTYGTKYNHKKFMDNVSAAKKEEDGKIMFSTKIVVIRKQLTDLHNKK